MNGVSGNEVWWKDSMVILGLSLPMSLWLFMSIFLSLKVAWISLPCGALIGFFLWLIALGYENSRIAKASFIGVAIYFLLALISVYLAFLA